MNDFLIVCYLRHRVCVESLTNLCNFVLHYAAWRWTTHSHLHTNSAQKCPAILGIALDPGPALCRIVLDYGPALCDIARDNTYFIISRRICKNIKKHFRA
jgi:hypothetical protein